MKGQLKQTAEIISEKIMGIPAHRPFGEIAVSFIVCALRKKGYRMKTVSVLSAAIRWGLLVGAVCGLIGSAGAQTPGPGQVGGMGQGGAPAGEFPSDRGSITYGQRYTPAEDFPPERIPANKDMNEDKNKNVPGESSGEISPQPEKRREEKADSTDTSAQPK
jgi:hypothetical protein